MENWKFWALGILIVLVCLLILSLIYCNQQSKKMHFTPVNSSSNNTNTQVEYKYAEITDPYDKPFILNNLLTPEQCQEIINYSRDKLIESKVVGGLNPAVRNSKQYWLSKHHPLIKPLYERVSREFNIPFENAEDLQVVRYEPGQFYKAHHDACCDNVDKCQSFTKTGGQRQLTVLVYLNDDFEGGYTDFPNLGFKAKADPGDAIVFYPLAKDSNRCHPLALHGGLPVTRGEKWIANLWFRQSKFKD